MDFTGGVCESVNLKDAGFADDDERRLTFFNSMKKAMSDWSLVGASITVNSDLLLYESVRFIELLGIVLLFVTIECLLVYSCVFFITASRYLGSTSPLVCTVLH